MEVYKLTPYIPTDKHFITTKFRLDKISIKNELCSIDNHKSIILFKSQS